MLRSRSLWLTIGLVFVGTALCAGFATTAASFSLSTSQQSEDQFGTADGWATLESDVAMGDRLPEDPVGALSADTAVEVQLFAQVGMVDDHGNAAVLHYFELPPEGAAAQGRFDLTSGRWPAVPGECVLPEASPRRVSAAVDGAVVPTGTAVMRYRPTVTVAVCAPGTWASWQPRPGVTLAAAASVYFSAPDPYAAASRFEGVRMVELRGTAEETVTTFELLALWWPTIGAGAALVIAAGVTAGGWFRRQHAQMAVLGVPLAVLRSATLMAVGVAGLGAIAAGTVAGFAAARAAAPIAQEFNGGRPLSEDLPLGLLAVTEVALVLSLMLSATAAARARGPVRPAGTGVWARRVGWVAVAVCGAVAIPAVLFLSTKPTDLMAQIALVALAAALLTALVPIPAVQAARLATTGWTLAGRILAGNRRPKLSAAATALTATVTVSILMLSSTSMAALTDSQRSPVPPGVVAVGGDLNAAEAETYQEVLSLPGEPAMVSERWWVSGVGAVWAVADRRTAAALFPELTEQDLQALANGVLVMLGPETSGEEVLADDGSQRVVPAVTADIPRARQSGIVGMILLADAPSRIFDTSVYTGFSPEELARLKVVLRGSGLDQTVVSLHVPTETFDIGTEVVVVVVGMTLVLAAIGGFSAGSAVAGQRAVFAGLAALGVPRRFAWHAQLGVFVATAVVPIGAATVGATVLTLAFMGVHAGEFVPQFLPWPRVLGFAAAALISAALGSLVAASRVRVSERLVDHA
ncbi:hypothetical protein CGZ91_00870 [Parenemella sanctibonifatiensis]|uniref:FtsX-like permease family protein n=1 Tax=Parenemella sanctibonifatiensis TaxID=2016505 RepID=A0A255ERL8_9ACTN|nr:hypothetical protein CGZ92_05885 [Parenemella sanctibonifatiensis]OYN92102.1 hypothetical protein CGZ91_00870 [Parenemella sanctibonifatiensis]